MRFAFPSLIILTSLGSPLAASEPQTPSAWIYCDVQHQRPSWINILERTEVKWGVSVEAQLALIAEEWGLEPGNLPAWWRPAWTDNRRGRPAIAPGYFDATWQRYEYETGNKNASYRELTDLSDFIGWYVASSADQVGLLPGDAQGLYVLWKRGVRYYQSGQWRSNTAMIYRSENFAERARIIGENIHSCLAPIEHVPPPAHGTPQTAGSPPAASARPNAPYDTFSFPNGVAKPFRTWSWRSKRGSLD